jgi:hypothetical protein
MIHAYFFQFGIICRTALIIFSLSLYLYVLVISIMALRDPGYILSSQM